MAAAVAPAKAACADRVSGLCLVQDTAGVCSKCATGSYVSKGKCLSATAVLAGCATASDGDSETDATCSECAVGFYPNTGTLTSCTACAATSNCLTCTATGCTDCRPGFFKATATATTCTACGAGGAATCDKVGNALTCLDNYGTQKHGMCFACDPTLNCATCTVYNTCATCAAGSSV